MKSSRLIFGITIILIFILAACSKDAGEGGNSSISGKVYVKDYNGTFTVLEDEYYGPGIWVYIIYGNDKDYSDRIETSYDGTYEFKYLRPGTYHVYAYSKDSTLQTNASIGIIKDVEITKNRSYVEVPDIVIFN